MIPFLNPWVILGVLLALAGAFASGEWQAHHADKIAYAAAIAQQKAEAATILADALRKNDALQQSYDAFKDQEAQKDADHTQTITDKDAALAAAIATAGGLRDKAGRGQSCRSNVPSGPQPTAGGDGSGLGCVLSGPVSDNLRALAKSAERDRQTALACQADRLTVAAIYGAKVSGAGH